MKRTEALGVSAFIALWFVLGGVALTRVPRSLWLGPPRVVPS